ncbi:TPA: hypothetical protein DDW69_03615 [candidate division CPR2 bacterium]|uniref:Zn-finger-like protein, nucleic acid binding protein n=1 Tax=candidate division CPR2 bacterium GW2011_GWC1_41_48 TaxID=1618344 RepID=A0A0G0Z7J1_UNCC2|nr:MAG: Zn-finger-like protein, nucleic acid binding protein [candidate division CPR2 bacterium GW2011_GWC2_39_35]KKR29368.1 MAG: Zn-finger-like protein, nucleic acid binding protein [candidate division CPR2 bacterium GW2011_GWD2_39_7]KKS09023.1 MAG: Zn-finger-like protein, nucleic acid binding protein [candidate division CPR2 bacterium GW2011_GWC1_41_48]OGB71190.1 MAG: hypothetical protein A2Y26_04230 [candidate division CPR2 bacterium GWD2_39_7]HBG81903.1 hypothetical protein [candidate divis
MKLNVKNLLSQEIGSIQEDRFSHPLKIEDLELIEPIEGKYRLIRLEKSIVGHFYIRLIAKINCARCLLDFDFMVEAEFDREFSQLPGEEFLPIKDFKIDIEESLREEVLLALPIKPLCDEGCKGLCPSCGRNLNLED